MVTVAVPPGRQTFIDPATGKPLSLGSVAHYVPGTFTPKLTWADEGQSVANPTVVPLDGGGQCTIWGNGLYRQILTSAAGVQIWDQITGFISSGGGGGGGNVFGPGASFVGHFATWGSTDGTQLVDGGVVGALAALNSITSALVSDFATAVRSTVAAQLVAGANVTITPSGATLIVASTGGGGGGGITGPGASTNNALVLWNGTLGTVVKDSGLVLSTDGLAFLSAGNNASMRTSLGLGTSAVIDTGTSGAKVPRLDTANTWTLAQTFSTAPGFSDQPGTRLALGLQESLEVAASDESTVITAGVGKLSFWAPYAMTLTEVWVANGIPSSSGAVQVDLKQNGVTVFTTKPSIGSGQNTSLSGAGSVAGVLTGGSTALAKGDKLTVDFSTVGTGAAGLKMILVGRR